MLSGSLVTVTAGYFWLLHRLSLSLSRCLHNIGAFSPIPLSAPDLLDTWHNYSVMKIQVKEHLTPVVATPSIALTFGLLADVISSLKHQTADRHSNQLVKTVENLAAKQPYFLNELVEARTEKKRREYWTNTDTYSNSLLTCLP